MLERAYSLFTVKSIDEDQRIIEGLASTPTTDRDGDIMEPSGAKFTLPLPLLWQHKPDLPIGHVISAKATAAGIVIKAQIAKGVLPRIDEAWALIKSGLVQGLSVGFRAVDAKLLPTGGYHFLKWNWFELSAVTIPANAEASIRLVKSLDAEHLAASGAEVPPVVPPSAGVSAIRAVKAQTPQKMKSTTEQISAFEATRAAKSARMTEIMQKAGDEGVTLDAAQTEEYDGLETEVKSIDAHLVRLASLEKAQAITAKPVAGINPKEAIDSRNGTHQVQITSNLPKGTGFTRYVMALAAGRGSRMEALQFAKRWERDSPEVMQVLKTAVDAGTTTDATWAAPLVVYQNMASEFIELLRPATIIGRIDGFRRVPFNISMPRQTAGSTVGWVGQGKPKPVGELAFDSISLGLAKAAGIVVIAEELARSSQPSAEAIIRTDLRDAIAKFLDTQFLDPSVAAVSNVSPAAVTNGASVVDSTGVTAAHLRADFASALAVWTAADLSIAGGVVVMTETQAIRLSMIVNAFGQPEFPGLGAGGGTLFGLQVVTSENIVAEGGSPAGKRIVLLKPSEILLADDGGIMVDVSREASVQMNTTPDDPATASTVNVSFWQNNLVGIRAERFINWLKRRSQAAVIIEGALYTG